MPNNEEVQRILALSDAEILAQMKCDGIRPDDIVRKGRAMLDRAIKQVDEEDAVKMRAGAPA